MAKKLKRPSVSSPSSGGSSPTGEEPTKLRLALTRVTKPQSTPSISEVDELLEMGRQASNLALKEVEIARQFSQFLPQGHTQAIEWLEETINLLTESNTNTILLFDEATGTYTCLNDEKQADRSPRELTCLGDDFLKALIGREKLITAPLSLGQSHLGFLVIADKADGNLFTTVDQQTLECVARYVSAPVATIQALKESTHTPYVKQVILDLSHRLVGAVDRDDVVSGVLQKLVHSFEFDSGQFVCLDNGCGEGQILCEYKKSRKDQTVGRFLSRQQHRVIEDVTALISLFTSSAWQNPYLLVKSNTLGDRSLNKLFGVHGAESALLMPVRDVLTGRLTGIFTLFRKQPTDFLPKSVLDIVTDASVLVSKALSRTVVLEKALALASSDELTGLVNRRGFYERFQLELERARRSDLPLCVGILDVDHFKRLNDEHGHLTGDRVLKALAVLFQDNVRKTDVVCRFGGEEFVFLLPYTQPKAAKDLLERVRKQVEQLYLLSAEGEALKVTVSAGVTSVGTQNAQQSVNSSAIIAEALAEADELLYQAKETGRNQVLAK